MPDYKSKLVGFGSDGAAVNTGINNGVIARFKETQKCLVGIHCHGHRLELAYKAALTKKPIHAKVDELLAGLYYFYRNNPLNRSDLLGACEVLGITKIVPTRVGGTRWLAYWQRALDNLWEAYPAIVSHLQTLTRTDQPSPRRPEATGKAAGYLKMLLDLTLVNYAHFLTDVINVLSNLSLFLQNESCLVSEVYLRVLATIGVLEQLKVRDGPRLKKFLQDIGNGPIKEFHGFVLKEQCPAKSLQLSLNARENMINSIAEYLVL
ncbi:hypothetical protein ACJMK2_016402 [Sinanodonta woodiana]|uniref:Zinc finger protein 862-like n=1 Tax=Sinanodonta woodiana TaxID=1069815 RepID=A0ABD3UTG2_SINWO